MRNGFRAIGSILPLGYGWWLPRADAGEPESSFHANDKQELEWHAVCDRLLTRSPEYPIHGLALFMVSSIPNRIADHFGVSPSRLA